METWHESHKLQGIGCQIAQGYLFAKPMSKIRFHLGIVPPPGPATNDARRARVDKR